MKILIYGGTFNPVHLAHINNINLICKEYEFDKILIMPNKCGHFKDDDELASVEDRLKMLDFAFKYLDKGINVEISRVEIDSDKKLYSNDSVDILKGKYPNSEFYFLIGSDQLKKLDKWFKIEELKEKVKFVVIKRNNNVNNNSEFVFIDNEVMPYSSTAIRNYYAFSGIDEVDKYIRKKGLYLNIVISHYLSDKRIRHSMNVARLAKKTAIKYDIDSNKAYVASVLHDIGKEMPLDKQYELVKKDNNLFELADATVHAYSAYYIVKDCLHINDDEILNAIRWHTTAYYKMSKLAKLIYCCDMLSEERDFIGIKKLRELLNEDLNECFKACFKASYQHLIEKNIKISNELDKLNKMIEGDEV